MLHFDEGGELKRAFLLTAVERNKNPQLRLRALQEIAASRDAEAFDRAIEMIGGWPREEKREGVKVVLQSLAEKKIGRRDQANNWIWACAEMTREVHEEYAVQRWPETKRLLGLLVNSSGGAHARNARRLVHAARQQDRRLAAALLAAALPHTAEAGEVINGARTRMSRKPAALARELLRNFPKGGKGRRGQRRRKKGKGGEGASQLEAVEVGAATFDDGGEENGAVEEKPKRSRSQGGSRRGRSRTVRQADPDGESPGREADGEDAVEVKPARGRSRAKPADDGDADGATVEAKSARSRSRAVKSADDGDAVEAKPARSRSRAAKSADDGDAVEAKPARSRSRAAKPADDGDTVEAKPTRSRSRAAKPVDDGADEEQPKRGRSRAAKPADDADGAAAEKPPRTRARATKAAADTAADAKPKRTRAKPATGAKPKRARTTKQDADAEKSIAAVAAATPRRRARPKASPAENGAATPLERASEAVRDAVRDSTPASPAGDEAA
jgi:ribonuclease E